MFSESAAKVAVQTWNCQNARTLWNQKVLSLNFNISQLIEQITDSSAEQIQRKLLLFQLQNVANTLPRAYVSNG